MLVHMQLNWKLLFPTARQGSARPAKTHVWAAESLSPPIRALSHSALSNGNSARAGGCAIISGSRFHSQPRASQFMERQVEPLMVPIKTTKNIIRPSDFCEDSCGGRVQPSPSWQTPTKTNTPRDISGSLTELFNSQERSSVLFQVFFPTSEEFSSSSSRIPGRPGSW